MLNVSQRKVLFSLVLCAACAWSASAFAQDADADGVPDAEEELYGDSDGDGIPNRLDTDDDGDTRPTRVEEDGTLRDLDRDGVPDYLDADDDGDGLVGLREDVSGDRLLDARDDSDGDGLIDPLDADDDGDGLDTRFELGAGGADAPIDTDRDGRPDYLDADDDGDGVSTRAERSVDPSADANFNGIVAYLDRLEVGPSRVLDDLDGDGLSDDVDPDDDGDTLPDVEERSGDSDGDGITDARDPDDDGDGVETWRELGAGTEGSSQKYRDTDRDETPDYLDTDDDGDGLLTRDEAPDQNRDGVADDPRSTSGRPDYLNADDDGDGLLTSVERPGGVSVDSDGDGTPDYLDRDDDDDLVETSQEAPRGTPRDSDGDGKPDHLDTDDDNDTLPTSIECSNVEKVDQDDDGKPNCLDEDSDGDGLLDSFEGLLDTDEDGIPDYLDDSAQPRDSDRDGIPDVLECESRFLGCADADLDGMPDYLDPDDDGDGVLTINEGARLQDTDGDETPDYLDADDDDDLIPTKQELGFGTLPRDTDSDGIPDYLDADDDGDGKLTRVEGGDSVDSDADGIPDYLDADSAGAWDAGAPQEGGVAGPGETSDGGGMGMLGTRSPKSDDGCSVAGQGAPRSVFSFLGVLGIAALLRRRRARSALAALALVGCADDDRGTVNPGGGGGGDGSVSADAGMDARTDARVDIDAEVPSCTSGSLSFEMGDSPARSFSAAIDGTRVHLAFVAPCGGGTSYGQGKGLRYVSFSSAGDAGMVLDVDDQDMCLPVREPTLLLHGADDLSLWFGSSRDDRYDLYQLHPLDTPRALVERTDDDAIEVSLSAAALGAAEAPFLAFVPEGSLPSKAPASIALLGAEGKSTELLSAALGHHPSQLSFARRLDGTNKGRGIIAWVSDRPETSGVYMRLVSDMGAPEGDPVMLSSAVGANSAVSIAARNEITGIVYTESPGLTTHQLRYRAIDAKGVLGNPVSLTSGNQNVREFAVSPYRNGFVVVYRNIDAQGRVTLRAVSLDAQGNTAASAILTESAGNGALQVVQSLDGRLMVFWDEPRPGLEDGSIPDFNRDLKVARISCI